MTLSALRLQSASGVRGLITTDIQSVRTEFIISRFYILHQQELVSPFDNFLFLSKHNPY